MAKLFGEIAAKSILTLDKSFARANGQPLDSSEIYYSLAAAEAYAKTDIAYIGQKIVVVENGVVTHYGIEDAAGTLKELGAKPVGDEKSIVVAEDGTISLKGISSLEFEREIVDENEQPTGETEKVQYQPLMTDAGLIWVEPSKTTVEGLATLIEALTARVKANEDRIGLPEDPNNEGKPSGLYKAIADEAKRATDAEAALDAKIGAASVPETTEGAGDGKDATGVYVAIEALADRTKILEEKEDKDTTYSVKEGEKVLSLTDTEFSTTLKLAYNDTKIQILGVNDALVTELDASASQLMEFLKMLSMMLKMTN